MAPPVTRELSLAYGGYTVGGSSDVMLHGPVLVDSDRESGGAGVAVVTFEAVLKEEAVADFATTRAAFEAAFDKPRQALTVTLDGQTLHSFSHTGSTGMNARPNWTHVGSTAYTGRSTHYRVVITFDLPADLSGANGLVGARERLEIAPDGRRRLVLAGRYTALSGTGARAQYEAQIATYEAAAQARVDNSLTWEEDGTPIAEGDDQDTILDFVRTYNERPAGTTQDGSNADSSTVVDDSLSIQRTKSFPGFSTGTGVSPLIECFVSYRAHVPKATNLKTAWENTILGHVIARVRARTGGSQVALVSSSPVFNEPDNLITATLTVFVADGQSILQSEASVRTERNSSFRLIPVYSDDVYAVYKQPAPGVVLRTATSSQWVLKGATRLREVASRDGGQARAQGGAFGFFGAFGQGQNPLSLSFGAPVANKGGLLVSAGSGETLGRDVGDELGLDTNGWEMLAWIDEAQPVVVGLPGYQIEMEIQTLVTLERAANVLSVDTFEGGGFEQSGDASRESVRG